MFRRIAYTTDNSFTNALISDPSQAIIDRADRLFNLHPSELYALLESAWSFRVRGNFPSGHPENKTALRGLPDSITALFDTSWFNNSTFVTQVNGGDCTGHSLWDHLIYAYVIESTQVYKVFRKLVENYAKGDFEINLTPEVLQWLHNTETLWFADPPVLSSFNMVSHLRSDMYLTRCGLYYRFFGFPLPGDEQLPYYKAKSSHLNYRRSFERFAEEVWIGVENEVNTTGRRPIDDAAIAFSAYEMQKNFLSQRNNGDITKQEFFFVSMMAWFHLSLEYNSPIVRAFGINEQSPAQRLFALANIVGVPANGLSENLFRLADNMSILLTMIESGIFNDEANVPQLYSNTSPISAVMKQIIFNYSHVSGNNLKARAVKTYESMPLPKGNGIAAGNGQPALLS
ncbi:hypothetical protein [Chitinophaga alhagiae]|uniref:hypothetical protein n=1 Tax=Chitinophaga alhagiae TaxID=2203219 RepID=UPI000E5BF3A2|nr:hypothetical protein [Chitinophaga alhagiae]